MMSAIILEDEVKNREILYTLLGRYCPQVHILACAASVADGRALLRENSPDILFLDVELSDGDCFELLESSADLSSHLIFTTAYSHYAVRAIKFAALDYLLKPIIVGELKEAVAKAEASSAGSPASRDKVQTFLTHRPSPNLTSDKIALPTLDGFVLVHLAEIIRFEARGNYTLVVTTTDEELTVSRLIQDFETLLADDNFCRIHKTHLVNLRHVKKYVKGKGGFVVMSDNSQVDVAARKREGFLERLRKA